MDLGQRDWPKLMLRLPPDAKAWVGEQAKRHATSQNSEIVRAIRERMDRAQAPGAQASALSTATHD